MRCLNCKEKVGWNTQICPSCKHLVVHDCVRKRILLLALCAILLLAVGIAIGMFII